MIYSNILLTARRHKREMWASREHRKTQSYNRANFASLIKLTVGVFYKFVFFILSRVSPNSFRMCFSFGENEIQNS